jgi:hypothetical protein
LHTAHVGDAKKAGKFFAISPRSERTFTLSGAPTWVIIFGPCYTTPHQVCVRLIKLATRGLYTKLGTRTDVRIMKVFDSILSNCRHATFGFGSKFQPRVEEFCVAHAPEPRRPLRIPNHATLYAKPALRIGSLMFKSKFDLITCRMFDYRSSLQRHKVKVKKKELGTKKIRGKCGLVDLLNGGLFQPL